MCIPCFPSSSKGIIGAKAAGCKLPHCAESAFPSQWPFKPWSSSQARKSEWPMPVMLCKRPISQHRNSEFSTPRSDLCSELGSLSQLNRTPLWLLPCSHCDCQKCRHFIKFHGSLKKISSRFVGSLAARLPLVALGFRHKAVHIHGRMHFIATLQLQPIGVALIPVPQHHT